MPGLIASPAQNWVAVAPTDMRRGLDGLTAIVQQSLGHSPGAASAFIFRNCAGNRLRLLRWDDNGVWRCQRRLHQGSFVWPKASDPVLAMTQAQWEWLAAGVDWQRLSACQWPTELSQFRSLKLSHFSRVKSVIEFSFQSVTFSSQHKNV